MVFQHAQPCPVSGNYHSTSLLPNKRKTDSMNRSLIRQIKPTVEADVRAPLDDLLHLLL